MMHRSSTTRAVQGSSSLTQAPCRPCRAKRNFDGASVKRVWPLAGRLRIVGGKPVGQERRQRGGAQAEGATLEEMAARHCQPVFLNDVHQNSPNGALQIIEIPQPPGPLAPHGFDLAVVRL